MNDLNLRVAALKLCAHPKRFAEMRGALVPLPPKWLNSQVDYVLKFAAATNCAKQMSIVKQIYEEPQAFGFLADVLFVCPLKHPVRGVVTRLFSNSECTKSGKTTHTKEILLSALRAALRYLAMSINNSTVHADVLNDVFVSVSACLHNFPFGRDALAQEIYCFIPLVPKALRLYWTTISEQGAELSPTRRNEFYLYIQNLLRFHVNFMTEYKFQLVVERCQQLRFIDELAECVARNVDTPWDVRAIAGLSIGHNARLFNDFDEYLTKCQELNDFNDLPIKAASLLVLQKSDYASRSAQALDILKRVLDQVKGSASITNFLVYLSKHLHTYSKSLAFIQLQDRAQIMYCLILAMLMRFSLEHISSSVESIRHMCANMLHQVLQHANAAGQTNIIGQVYAQFERHRMPLPSVCLMLQQLVEVMGTKSVLQNCPSIFDKMFPAYLGLEDSVNSLFKCMMTVAHREEESKDWLNVWCTALIKAAQPCDDRLAAIERLIKSAVQLEPDVLPEMLKQRNLPFSTKLAALLTARRHGQHRLVKSLMAEHIEQISAALIGVDDNTRLLALCFVVETPRLSEPYTRFELDSIISYLQNNVNNPSAHMRQIGHGLMQKAVKRLEHNLAQQIKETTTVSEDHMLINFLNTLLNMLALNLFPTANYGRRWLSMRILRDCIEMLERLGLPWLERMPPQTLPFVDHCLRDSYEHNKLQAAHLLAKLQKCSRHQPAEMMEMLLSARPPDSATGAYQLQVYCKAAEVDTPLPETLELPKHHPRYYAVLQLCLQHLRDGVVLAQTDLTLAAKTNPLYGLLFASRHLLQQLELKQLAEDILWRQYVDQLLHLCITISDIVLPVVGSESPEGHLPGDRPTEEEDPKLESKQELDTLSIVPQLVLLCAWRSIKEISLLMGELVQRAPLQQERKHHYLLSQEQVAIIGEQFLLLLADIKHRGAFEQAYVGFSLLCRRFWHSDEPALNQLPPVWLDEAMQLVVGDGGKDLCATRRSAGMPYMLQALICTELKLGTHHTFSKSMSLLLDVCERRGPGPDAAVARSHAMNIMRALFRCSELAELVGEFVGRGIMCALESLVAVEWAERNSATLMLSALMVRIFGVERARTDVGELHVRNRMTGRIFFTRYPQLFDYFHAGLKQAAEEQQTSGGHTVQLEATLQLLSRLYPSSMEGAESSLNLSEFVPFLQQIACVHDNTTRYRASQVLANFVNATTAIKRIRRIAMVFKVLNFKHNKHGTLPKNLNKLHGITLQLMELYRIARWQDVRLISTTMYMLSLAAIKIYEHNMFIFNAILNVLIAIMQDAQDGKYFGVALLNALLVIYELDHEAVYKRCELHAISPKFYVLFGLHLQRLTQKPENLLETMQKLLVQPENLPSTLEQLKIDLWLYVLIQQSNGCSKTRGLVESYEVKHFQFDPDVMLYYKSLSPAQRLALAAQLRESDDVQQHVMKIAAVVERGPRWAPGMAGRVYALLAMLNKLELTTKQLLERGGFDAEPGVVICITRHIMQSGMRQQYQPLWLPLIRYALHIAAPKKKSYLRYRAAQLLDRLTVHVQQVLYSDDADIIGNYIRLVLQLLVDESELVRNYTSEMVSSCMGLYLAGDLALGDVSTVSLLPMAAEKFFLQHMLDGLQRYKTNGSFLIAIFNLIVEPFVSSELLANRTVDEDSSKAQNGDDDAEVFDKQELNLYCEGLRVVSHVAKSFKIAFANNRELIIALNALEKLCSYNGFGDQPIPPRIIS
ncbi:thyroid adenoma-associated protein homolog isoform X1 [Drosophila novamexicana]|uniref:thyroid adenoma-associated protein homolog isoform X1 n=1 Tax=Drosophila novamexicana TaxID=47314 RepID=UPI0011E5BDBE|nr:thyroid adenoma-associated protein homolog isoform X1 [Drosophila novamexicana]